MPGEADVDAFFGHVWFYAIVPAKPRPASRKVFIVHGHDEALLEQLDVYLLRLRLDPVILREQADEGRTIIEKLEAKAGDVALAIVLFTPDDVRYERIETQDFLGFKTEAFKPHVRVRNNVMLEFGYFLGKLGRSRVIVLRKAHPQWEMPSDIDGVLYIPLDDAGKWKAKLAAEIHARGLDIEPGRIQA
jgi:predicted nucleotide-binding protein